MIKIYIDTCVWLTICSKFKYRQITNKLISLATDRKISILTNDIILDEFIRNEEHVKKSYIQSFKSSVDQVKILYDFVSEEEKVLLQKLIAYAKSNEQKIIDKTNFSFQIVKNFLQSHLATKVTISPELRVKIIDLALEKRAPFHRNKNSIADALHILSYKDYKEKNYKDGDVYYFCTENTEDFSHPKNESKNHSDFDEIFNQTSSIYSTNIAEILENYAPDPIIQPLVDQIKLESYYCIDGKGHTYSEDTGAYLRSRYGGLTWQLRCEKCGQLFDTGEFFD
ncbi:PIN domain-containing protein [Leptospira perdikensis]|uniref:DUF4935 domain-containing protein n=1 Tax=Leptospira perdikensis TaxID=2484948 RepID=A0A4R9JA62_9LEPT|nr:PIN domain-containing protein [Leptospira perdikensis]TGL35937.1 hypothetical protein EHQ49_16710 [Leptospira perdikensis]